MAGVSKNNTDQGNQDQAQYQPISSLFAEGYGVGLLAAVDYIREKLKGSVDVWQSQTLSNRSIMQETGPYFSSQTLASMADYLEALVDKPAPGSPQEAPKMFALVSQGAVMGLQVYAGQIPEGYVVLIDGDILYLMESERVKNEQPTS